MSCELRSSDLTRFCTRRRSLVRCSLLCTTGGVCDVEVTHAGLGLMVVVGVLGNML